MNQNIKMCQLRFIVQRKPWIDAKKKKKKNTSIQTLPPTQGNVCPPSSLHHFLYAFCPFILTKFVFDICLPSMLFLRVFL
jgi:hypothetical protein